MKNYAAIILLFVFGLNFSCQPKQSGNENTSTLFSEMDSSMTNVLFENTIINTPDLNIFNYRNFYNGGGVGLADINNDELLDIYFTSNQGSNKLYLNKGDFKFEDITDDAGVGLDEKWSTGVSFVDINQDGLIDIYVCNAGYSKGKDQKNSLFINKGDLRFVESAEEYGLDDNGYTTHAAFFDYDKDGDLDVYILNNSFIPVNTLNYSNKRNLRAEDWEVAEFLKGGGDKLLRNDNGLFHDVSNKSGIYGSLIGFGLGVTVGDVNNDDWPDIYVSNDFFERDYLYINQKNGSFSEELENRMDHISHSSMGADMADINNDGSLEIFVTDMLPDDDYRLKTNSTFDNINLRKLKENNGFYHQYMHNTLQYNNGFGQFSEIAFTSGVARSDWSWGALMFDADNDSYNDLLVCNGIYRDVIDQDFIDFFANEVIQKIALSGEKASMDSVIQKMPSVPLVNKFYRNENGIKFSDDSEKVGFTKPTFSNGASYGDLDNDGDYDLVINNVNQVAQVFKNNSSNNFLSISLKYQVPNIQGIGAKINLYSADTVWTKSLFPNKGFQSSVDLRLNFGLANRSIIDSLEVIWPNDTRSVIYSPNTNQSLLLDYGELPKSKFVASNQMDDLLNMRYVQSNFSKHEEDDYNDFYYERNVPMDLSKQGPCIAKGDFNGDSIVDLYIGGAAGQGGNLFQGIGNGQFRVTQKEYFDKFNAFEDTYALFLDCDGDGDEDLIVGSGGNNVTLHPNSLRDRLYLNQNGTFELALNNLPAKFFNTSVIKSFDFDHDGDLDLFVGCRSIPGNYGVSPGSYIYVNDGTGHYLDLSSNLAPDLRYASMITDAVWADIFPGGAKELVIVGEWMSPQILSYNGKTFDVLSTNLINYSGWWNAVDAFDHNGDGILDLVFGNIGTNFYLEATPDKPLTLWINDFDGNGAPDKIITQRLEGKDKPVLMKGDLMEQIPELKRKNFLHKEYASKSIHDLFPKDLLMQSEVKSINCSYSAVAINQGSEEFELVPLPYQAQLSCINVINHHDIDEDGKDDLIIGGNNYYLLPQFSRLDAIDLLILQSKGNGHFEIPNFPDRTVQKGMINDMVSWREEGNLYILEGRNNESPAMYSIKKN